MTRRLSCLLLLLLIPAAARAQQTSREIFTQARAAAAGSEQAIALYRRYTEMEPRDAWGHLALADALIVAQRFTDAEAAVRRAEALAPSEDDVAIVRARLERARRVVLPSIKPSSYFSRDTDANTTITIGAAGDVAMSPRVRTGLTAGHTIADDGTASATVDRALGTLAIRTTRLRWESEIGGARITHDRTRDVLVGQTHLRFSNGSRGFTADLRVRQLPVTSAYALVNAETMLREARGLVDVPLFAGLKLRGTGQAGSIETSLLVPLSPTGPGPGRGNNQPPRYVANVVSNQRYGYGGGVVLPYSPVSELSLTAYRLQYDHPSTGQYFAPEYVDVLELGTYAEIYRFDPLTIAVDAGVGAQRAKNFYEPVGEISPAARIWTLASLALSRYLELNGEVDYYRSQLSTVTTGASWSSLSGGVSLRWLIR